MAEWAKIPASALGLVKTTNVSLMDILKPENEMLRDIRERFAEMIQEGSHPIEITCFCEALPLPWGGIVVSQDSAGLEGKELYTVHASHRDMVRFGSAEDNGFKRLLGELIRWESQIKGEAQVNPGKN